jgi:hypothetical protein
MTYLIDTDVMVDFFKHKDPAKGLIARLELIPIGGILYE